MTDIATEVETAVETDIAEAATETKPTPAPKVKTPCTCSRFEVGQESETHGFVGETTGCTAETSYEFAQGHDAKLASFLSRAEIDGLQIRETVNGVVHFHATASAAASGISAPLQTKVERQVAKGLEKLNARKERETSRNDARKARETERALKKAEREAAAAKRKAEKDAAAAAKAQSAAPREVAATVVEGSQEGDTPTEVPTAEPVEDHPEQTRIKVGRWEYDAVIDADGNAEFLDSDGVLQTREAGTFRTIAS